MGRQRYESLLRFFDNKFKLKDVGLQKLKDWGGRNYENLAPNLRTLFEEFKIKMICYMVPSSMFVSDEDLERVGRDLFRRYNFGMASLKPTDIARAKYCHDKLTRRFRRLLKKEINTYEKWIEFFAKSVYWMFSILYYVFPNKFYDFNIDKFCHYVEDGGEDYFETYNRMSGQDTQKRMSYMKEYLEKELIKILNSNNSTKKNKNCFYIMWLILQELDTHRIQTYKKEIFKDLEQIFKLMQNMPKDKDERHFMEHVKNMIDKYCK